MKYIDSEKLIAEIDRQKVGYNTDGKHAAEYNACRKILNIIDSLQQDPRFPLYDNIVEKVFGAGNLEGWERDEAEMLVVLAKEELLKSLQQEQPDNWDDEYREDELLTRFAFYTYKDEDSVLYLSNVFVEETSRNKGFGTKILAAAEKVAETIGAINIRLKAKKDSPANSWYRKHGYGYMTFEGDYDWLQKTLEYMKPKQERQEVDLEKEIEWEWVHREKQEVDLIECAEMDKEEFVRFARHFYELGRLNARKEQQKVELENEVEFYCINKKVRMTIQELINYYIDTECAETAIECGF